jgi:hypothetical protein
MGKDGVNTVLLPPPVGTGGGGSSVDLTPLLAAVNQLNETMDGVLNELIELVEPGQNQVTIDYWNTVSNVGPPAPLYTTGKNVKNCIVQNLSNTDAITIFAAGKGGTGKSYTGPANGAGQAAVLNPATAAGQAGGSFPFGNIDLSTLSFISSANASQAVSVKYEY